VVGEASIFCERLPPGAVLEEDAAVQGAVLGAHALFALLARLAVGALVASSSVLASGARGSGGTLGAGVA